MFWLRNGTSNYFISILNQSPDTCHCKLIFTYRLLQNKFLICFYNKVFFSILTAFPPPPPVTNHAVFIWCVKCKTTTVCKGLVWSRGESTSVKLFLFSICWIAKTEFSTRIFQLVLVQWENSFCGSVEGWTYCLIYRKNIIFFETFLWSLLWAILH